MSPQAYITYILFYSDRTRPQDFKNMARMWNMENKGYSEIAPFKNLRFRMSQWRCKKHNPEEWRNFDVAQYMKFINQHIHFG